jgi:hypothetical protein
MFRSVAVVLFLSTLLPATALAQDGAEPDQQSRPSTNVSPKRPSDESRRSPAVEPKANVRIELTIADSTGTGTPQKKAVSMIVADGMMGRIRSVRSPNSPTLNVDAQPRIGASDQIRLQLTLEYTPPISEKPSDRGTPINEFVTVLLQSGKPLVISQAADPSIDRKVTVEVTATVLK